MVNSQWLLLIIHGYIILYIDMTFRSIKNGTLIMPKIIIIIFWKSILDIKSLYELLNINLVKMCQIMKIQYDI